MTNARRVGNVRGASIDPAQHDLVIAYVRKPMFFGTHRRPGLTVVHTAEESVPVLARYQFVGIARIPRKAEAVHASLSVAVEPRRLPTAERLPSVSRNIYSAWVLVTVAADEDNPVGVARIDGQRPHMVGIAIAVFDGKVAVQRPPMEARVVAAIRAADINVCVPDVRGRRRNHHVLDIAATVNENRFPI